MLTQTELLALHRSLRGERVLSIYIDGSAADPAEQRSWRTQLDHLLGKLRHSLDKTLPGEEDRLEKCFVLLSSALAGLDPSIGAPGWAAFVTSDRVHESARAVVGHADAGQVANRRVPRAVFPCAQGKSPNRRDRRGRDRGDDLRPTRRHAGTQGQDPRAPPGRPAATHGNATAHRISHRDARHDRPRQWRSGRCSRVATGCSPTPQRASPSSPTATHGSSSAESRERLLSWKGSSLPSRRTA